VLNHYRRSTITLEDTTKLPNAGEVIDEEENVDKEVFVDNFPLFPGEPDAIITEQTYYESWAYSFTDVLVLSISSSTQVAEAKLRSHASASSCIALASRDCSTCASRALLIQIVQYLP